MHTFDADAQVIFDKYPRLFRQVTLSKEESCMYWGLQCGKGWYPIIEAMCKELEEKFANRIEIAQIKEKFGILRVSPERLDKTLDMKEIWECLCKYEEDSSVTCEKCGVEGKLQTINGWLSTLCDEHATEKKNRKI